MCAARDASEKPFKRRRNGMPRQTNTAPDLHKVLAGDKRAWDAFVEEFAGLILSTVQRVFSMHSATNKRQDVPDVVQNVFLKLVKNDYALLKTYDPKRARLSTWLVVITRSAAIDHLRSPMGREIPSPLAGEETLVHHDPEPDDAFLLLDELSGRQETVMRLLYQEDLDVSEVAGILRINPQTVRSIRHQALKKLRSGPSAGALQ